MYVHLGENIIIKKKNIIGIFDLDKLSTSEITNNYLNMAQKRYKIVNVSMELPKSFIVCEEFGGEEVVYISQLNPSTIYKRIINSDKQGY